MAPERTLVGRIVRARIYRVEDPEVVIGLQGDIPVFQGSDYGRGCHNGVARRIVQEIIHVLKQRCSLQGDQKVFRVEQQPAPLAPWRAQVGVSQVGQSLSAGDLRESAVAVLRASARAQTAVERRVLVGPYDDLPPIPRSEGVGGNPGTFPDDGARCRGHVAPALVIAADQRSAAAGAAGDVHRRLVQAHPIAQHLHFAAFAAVAAGRGGAARAQARGVR